jgi:hypothetical protein
LSFEEEKDRKKGALPEWKKDRITRIEQECVRCNLELDEALDQKARSTPHGEMLAEIEKIINHEHEAKILPKDR